MSYNQKSLFLLIGGAFVFYHLSSPVDGGQWNFTWLTGNFQQADSRKVTLGSGYGHVPVSSITEQGARAQIGTAVKEVWDYAWRRAASDLDVKCALVTPKTPDSATPMDYGSHPSVAESVTMLLPTHTQDHTLSVLAPTST